MAKKQNAVVHLKQNHDLEVFIIHDSKVNNYRDPIYAINKHDIIRQFQNLFGNPEQRAQNSYFLNAEDFSIFKIGGYTRKTGILNTHEPKHIANLHELKAALAQ